MLKAFKYRLYPTKEQEILLCKHFGACRFLYNLALETKMAAYSSARINLSRYDLTKQIPELKKDCDWLREINAQSLQSELMHLDGAYLKFFKGLSSFPKFKKRGDRQSFQCPQSCNIQEGKLKIPKFPEGIKMVISRPFIGEMRTVTISKTPTGKYFASILSQDNKAVPKKKKVKENTAVGVDMGLKTFAALSDGQEYENPKHLKKSLKRLKMLQKRASKKKKGSANRKKANLRVALLHEKVTNQRKDFLHKFSDAITKQYDTILVENLHIAGMIKNHKLAQAIGDVGWSMGLDFIKYKSEWRGKTYHEIGRFDASSKLHNKCGYLNKELTLADRTWLCPKCGETVERDMNAALNIKQMGLNYLGLERPDSKPAETLAKVRSMKQETKIS
jgi:putative transposase